MRKNFALTFSENSSSTVFIIDEVFGARETLQFVVKLIGKEDVLKGYRDLYVEFIRPDGFKTIQRTDIEILDVIEPTLCINCKPSVVDTIGQGYGRIVVSRSNNEELYSSVFIYTIKENPLKSPSIEYKDDIDDLEIYQETSNRETLNSGGQWLDGTGIPENSIGVDGNYYLELDNADIFKKSYGTWKRIGNIKGVQGPEGIPGLDGANGLDGKDGLNGLDGKDGLNGLDGKDGNRWLDGVGTPNGEIGNIGDYYINIVNADIYKKTTDTNWERVGAIARTSSRTSITPDDFYTKSQIDQMISDIASKQVESYTHNQISALKVWTISHNLNRFPQVSIVDSGNNVVVGDVTYIDTNSIKVEFQSEFSGMAYLI